MGHSSRVLTALLIFGISASAASAAETKAVGRQPVPSADASREAIISSAVIPQAELVPKRVPAPVCDRPKIARKIKELVATASKSSPSVEIDCSLALAGTEVITKRLIFKGTKASGVTVEGNGATINGGDGTFNYDPRNAALMVEIASDVCQVAANGEPRCPRPENITLRNLKIKGSVAIYGNPGVESSHKDFVRLARTNAPANIVFDNVTITGLGLPCGPLSGNCNLLYLYSGVSHFKMLNSEINGNTSDKAVNIYLDDTSFRNTFRNNTIRATTKTRELIAIDGSSENIFINNRFKVLNEGGIYLYRNCGEGGSERRGRPSNNTFVNNVFFYDTLNAGRPAIVVASRNGRSTKTYTCPPNFFDLARFNVVMQNQILPDRPSINDSSMLSAFIRVDRPDVNTPNYIKDNEIVDGEIKRGAGCYISDGYPDFIRDGQSVNVFQTANGEPVCRGFRLTCRDGELGRSSDSTCNVSQVSSLLFECPASGTNKGCQKTVSGPPGKKLIGFKAACNLEFGGVSTSDLDGVPANSVKVLRASDNVSEGRCTLGRTSISSGQSAVGGINGQDHVSFGCREKDSNGGDCHIKTRLFFQ